MLRKLLGAAFAIASLSGLAVAFGGLLTYLSSAPAKPEAVSYVSAGTSESSGSDLFSARIPASAGDSHDAIQVVDSKAESASSRSLYSPLSDAYSGSLGMESTIGDAPKLESFQRLENPAGANFLPSDADSNHGAGIRYASVSIYSGYFDIPPTMRSNINYSVPVEDPLYAGALPNKLNSETDKSATDTRPSARDSKVVLPPRRWKASYGPAKSTRRPEAGCTRCVGSAAQANSGRTKSLGILFSAIIFRRGGPVRRGHQSLAANRARQDRLLADRTVPRDCWNCSL